MKAARATSFYDHVKQALELFHTPAELGEQSPLATAYVLGAALHGFEATASGRGQALINLIQRACEQLWGGVLPGDGQVFLQTALNETVPGGKYDCLVLELNYLKQCYRPTPKNQVEIYTDILHISRPTHDRHLRSAIERLAATLLQQLRPALQLEQPIAPDFFIGREALIKAIGHDLSEGKAVNLSGASGVGKSALAASVVQQRPHRATFWYTFRRGFNDQLESLLFALGHFLHQQGASNLWHQLIVDRGRIAGSLALGLVLADLHSLPQPVLLCFDELDQVRIGDLAQARSNQIQLVAFLEGLQRHVALLMIGQTALIAADTHYSLDALPPEQLSTWLDTIGIHTNNADLQALVATTAGNPRLVELCVALYQANPAAGFAAVLNQLPETQSLIPIWFRLERQLSATERHILQLVSVFPAAMPSDVVERKSAEQQQALQTLIERRLLRQNERGGVSLLPALRDVIYHELLVETREELHQQAAQIHAERGEYTTAAYHLIHAGEPEMAIDLWYANRETEINQGQAASALALFNQISQRRIDDGQRRTFLLLRAELHELVGESARVAADLLQFDWPAEEPTTPGALLRLGQAYESQGQPAQALQTYQAGLEAMTHLLQQGTQLHVQRSLSHVRQRQMHAARREADLAHFHARVMLGVVNDQSGEYTIAQQHYQEALAIAEHIDYLGGMAQTAHYLAMLAGRRNDLPAAREYFSQAMAFYQHTGDRINQEIVRSNLASAYIQVRQFAEALEPAEQALQFFEAMGNSVRMAQNASNLAEAHVELGNLDQAQFYARKVLELNEPQSHPYALYTLGTVYRLRGDWLQSEHVYDQSRRIAEVNDDSYLQAFAWRAIGELAAIQKQQQQAHAAFTQARSLFEQLKIAEEVRETDRIAARHDAYEP